MKSIGGLKPREVDAIFDEAIEGIGSGREDYSCNALSRQGTPKSRAVRRFYTKVMSSESDIDGGSLLLEIMWSYITDRRQRNLRILMLSLVKVAWRDLV